MAIPVLSSRSTHQDPFGGRQLDLLSPAYGSPHFPDEAPGAFGLSFSPALVRHLIHTHSRPGDTVLDCFLGGGTTVYEALMMGRQAVGVDCNERYVEEVRSRLLSGVRPSLYTADARSLPSLLEPESIDLVITQPPYGNTHPFSSHLSDDLSRLASREFLLAIEEVADSLWQVLKPGGLCALQIGDIKDRGRMMPLGFQFVHRFLSRGFSVKVMYDHRTPLSTLPLTLHPHEYLILFQKKESDKKQKTTKSARWIS